MHLYIHLWFVVNKEKSSITSENSNSHNTFEQKDHI